MGCVDNGCIMCHDICFASHKRDCKRQDVSLVGQAFCGRSLAIFKAIDHLTYLIDKYTDGRLTVECKQQENWYLPARSLTLPARALLTLVMVVRALPVPKPMVLSCIVMHQAPRAPSKK